MTVIVALFRSTVSLPFTLALADFHRKILDLTKVYRWEGGVLPLALNLHTYIVEGHLFDSSWWKIPVKWQACFCNSLTTKYTSARVSAWDSASNARWDSLKQKRSSTSTRDANDTSVSCMTFNKRACKCPSCWRWHKCDTCGEKDHRGRVYRNCVAPDKEATLGVNRWHIGVGDSVERIDSAVSSRLI